MRKIIIILASGLFILSCTTNQPKEMTNNNPFFSEFGTPFEVPDFDKIKTEHFMPAFTEGMKLRMEEIDVIVNNEEAPTFENTIVSRDQSGELLTGVSSVFYNLSSAVTNDEIQAIAKEVAPLLSAHRDNISLNEALFARVKAVYENREALNLNAEQQILLEKTYKNFVREGLTSATNRKLGSGRSIKNFPCFRFGSEKVYWLKPMPIN